MERGLEPVIESCQKGVDHRRIFSGLSLICHFQHFALLSGPALWREGPKAAF